MTSTNVTQAAALFPGAAPMPQVTGGAGAGEEGFSQVMKTASADMGGQSRQKSPDLIPSGAPVQKADPNSIQGSVRKTEQKQDVSGNQKAADDGVSKMEKPKTTNVSEVKDAVEEAVGEVKEVIEDALDISEEELEAIMETLGLTGLDLLDPDSGALSQIVMEAAGETDFVSLLTNEALYQNLDQMTEAVGEITAGLQEELQVGNEEFTALLSQMEAVPAEERQEVNELVPDLQEEGGSVKTAQEGAAAILSSETENAVPLAAALEEEPEQESSPLTKSGEELPGESEEEIVPLEKTEKSAGQKTESREEKQENSNSFLQNFSKAIDILTMERTAPVEDSSSFYAARSEDVMNQVTEYMRLQARPDTTELELQLQPETLGTIHIRIAAKEGAITAQFTAQNEAVRAVLESQVIQLRENLNNQGVKVEAVEVTVASHGFERNLQQEGGQDSQYEEPKKKGPRKIQLDEDIPIEEMELEEEDRIAAEMMEANGNTIDYTA